MEVEMVVILTKDEEIVYPLQRCRIRLSAINMSCVMLCRTETLRHGAIQQFFCVRYKTDPKDNTVGMSPYSLSAPNADFDGDALYLLSIKEMTTVLDCMKIHPISTLLGGEGGSLFPAVKMSSEMSVAGNGYLHDGLTKSISDYKKAAGL